MIFSSIDIVFNLLFVLTIQIALWYLFSCRAYISFPLLFP